ncbi:MAG: guanylate kinase [Bacillota bacterium]
MAEGILLIISGPSGVGKGTVCRYLLKIRDTVSLSVSTTTRPPRPAEREGVEYHFTTVPDFKRMIEEGDFLEWAVVHGHYYGTGLMPVNLALARGEDLILEIDVQGAIQVMEKTSDAVSIFMAPPSLKALEDRIKGRGTESTEKINRRLETARQEMKSYHLYDYIIVNDTVEHAAEQISSIIDAEKCKVSRGAKPPGWGGESK